ncbi:MAG: S8 family serine peptidase [Candidatus Competibacter sp.]
MRGFIRISVIALSIFGLLRPAISWPDEAQLPVLAADFAGTSDVSDDSESLNAYPRPPFDLLSEGDRAVLDRGQPVDVLVEFDQTEAVSLAQVMRQQSALSVDSEEILVKRAASYRQQKEQVRARIAANQMEWRTDYPNLPMAFARLRSAAALQSLLAQAGVKAVHSNTKMKLSLARSLPLIHQPQTAAQGGTGANVSVAVLDTGVDYTNAALGSCAVPGGNCKVTYAADFAPDDSQPDDDGHGTNVAAIVAGVAPGARIVALDVFRKEGVDQYAYVSDVLKAIDWVIANKTAYNIVAINLSVGGDQYTAPCNSDVFATPATNARSAGILTAAAAGNETVKNALGSPACVPAVVSVGAVYSANFGAEYWLSCTDATTQADQVVCFSNSASFLTLLAPGAEITAAGYTYSGTSQATPHVAGAIAVLRAAYPNESLDFTVGRLTSTGVPITDTNGIAKPRIDLLAAYHAGMRLSGRVSLNGIPVCAMVLANGKSTFSCDGSGRFSLADVPLDDAGQITLFAWADNMNPYKTVFAPSSISTDMEVLMTASPCDGTGENTGGSISGLQNSALSGIIRLSGTSTPVCAFVLANGQSTFSCDGAGHYSLANVPVDSQGQITLFAWADGFLPHRLIFRPSSSQETHDLDMKIGCGG